MKTNIAIIGANGYIGYQLLKLLANHSEVEVKYAVDIRKDIAGTAVGLSYHSLAAAYPTLKYEDVPLDKIAKDCKIVFLALPHATAADIGGKLYDMGVNVVDLSADFRYDNIPLYEQTYNIKHPRKDINPKAVYGLVEIYRDKIKALAKDKKNPALIGNPGCYTTSCILPLYPLLKNKLIKADTITIDAKSGVSGAGRRSEVDFGFCELDNNFKAYSVAVHRHSSEMEEKLSFGDKNFRLCFVPHLLPIKRGILSTIYADVSPEITSAQIADCFKKAYGNERFVKVLSEGTYPSITHVANSNTCYIGYKLDTRTRKLIIISCLDNLIKGAAGQAIQNMNIILGIDEATGLPVAGEHL
ncbi:MAG: N-acetyl-gamma-glutamyl-phosphate reductase [Firmicutes bacterium]|nr:N-acetyl-gamma-glutamyl-phosphate reductase [Bacillota bacterium]